MERTSGGPSISLPQRGAGAKWWTIEVCLYSESLDHRSLTRPLMPGTGG